MAVCLSGHVFPHFLLPPLSGCPLCFTLFKKRLYCKESRFLFLSFFFFFLSTPVSSLQACSLENSVCYPSEEAFFHSQ